MRYVPIDRANILTIVLPQPDHEARIAEIGREAWAEEVLDLFVKVAIARGASKEDALRAIALMAAVVRNATSRARSAYSDRSARENMSSLLAKLSARRFIMNLARSFSSEKQPRWLILFGVFLFARRGGQFQGGSRA